MQKQIYPSDLTGSQWKQIKNLFPVHTGGGRPRELDLRQILNAIFYLLRTGCQWRYLPIEYPCWQSVYYYLRLWQRTGIWQQIHNRSHSELRSKNRRHKHPTAGCLDSQAVKTTSTPGVNDTTTAITCIDNLGEIIGLIAGREMPALVRSKDMFRASSPSRRALKRSSKRRSTRYASAAKRILRFSSGF